VTGAFNNSGSVTVPSGKLSLEGGGTHTGTFTAEAPGVIAFAGGTHGVNGTANLIGGTYNVTGTTRVSGGFNHGVAAGVTVLSVGALYISGGSFSLSGGEPVTVPSYLQTGGTLGGSDTITVTGMLVWHGGFIDGSGTTNAAGGLSIIADTQMGL